METCEWKAKPMPNPFTAVSKDTKEVKHPHTLCPSSETWVIRLVNCFHIQPAEENQPKRERGTARPDSYSGHLNLRRASGFLSQK